MYNTNIPTRAELPSAGKLLFSTIVAAIVAILILIVAVLPAEYGIDPTGIGRTLGLTEMGEIKTSLAEEAVAEQALFAATSDLPAVAQAALAAPTEPGIQEHVMTVTLKPGQAAEIKLTIRENVTISYEWFTDGRPVNYDTHGDPFGAPRNFYHGYGKGRNETRQSGELTAAFDGTHGWFWRNRSDGDVTITLKTRGAYEDIKRVI